MSTPQPYEFDEAQNETIGKLARSMQTVGLVMMVFGVLGIASVVVAFVQHQASAITFGTVLDVILLTIFGYWTRNAGNSFDAVVRTQGNDMPHLMSALGDLGKMYGLVRTVIVLFVCLFVAFIIVMAVSALFFAPHH